MGDDIFLIFLLIFYLPCSNISGVHSDIIPVLSAVTWHSECLGPQRAGRV
jgi:hypothetical protein